MATVALLAGCGSEQHASEPGADIDAAAQAAQGDIDTYAANSLQPSPPVAAATVRPPLAVMTNAKPTAAPPRAPDNGSAATETRIVSFRCADDTRVSVRFDAAADTATIRSDERDLAVLAGQRPGSGLWYKGGGYELRGTGGDADYSAPGREPVSCRAD